jgi:hypothetical protein
MEVFILFSQRLNEFMVNLAIEYICCQSFTKVSILWTDFFNFKKGDLNCYEVKLFEWHTCS